MPRCSSFSRSPILSELLDGHEELATGSASFSFSLSLFWFGSSALSSGISESHSHRVFRVLQGAFLVWESFDKLDGCEPRSPWVKDLARGDSDAEQ